MDLDDDNIPSSCSLRSAFNLLFSSLLFCASSFFFCCRSSLLNLLLFFLMVCPSCFFIGLYLVNKNSERKERGGGI